jgi:hypothetical protein
LSESQLLIDEKPACPRVTVLRVASPAFVVSAFLVVVSVAASLTSKTQPSSGAMNYRLS